MAAVIEKKTEVTTGRTLEDVREEIKRRKIDFLFAQFVDMYARPSGKLVPANHLDDLFTEGAGFAGFAAGEIGQGPHSTDMMAIPDPNSFTPLPWQRDLARFACDIRVEGEEWPYDPRTILRRQLAKAKAKGYVFKIGAECEFFLLRQVDGRIEIADALDNAEPEAGAVLPPSITTYSGDAKGDAKPLRKIQGERTRLDFPMGRKSTV